jgi:hypothetical protein
MAFDPWLATFEEAKALTDEAIADGASLGNPSLPLCQLEGAGKVRECEKLLAQTNDRFYVVKAAMHCAQRDLVMPEWLANEFCASFYAVNGGAAGSWDDQNAFGRPWPKGAQLKAIRKRRMQRAKVGLVVRDLLRETDVHGKVFPVGKEFWRIIGIVIGSTANEAQELYKKQFPTGTDMDHIKRRRLKQSPFFENTSSATVNGTTTVTRTRIQNPKSFETLWGVNPFH